MRHLCLFRRSAVFYFLSILSLTGCLPVPVVNPNQPILDYTKSTEAMRLTAENNPSCRVLGDFYWSYGGISGRIGSGKVGTLYDSATRMAIFSASKMVFSTYVVEKKLGILTPSLIKGLNFTSGYISPSENFCSPTDTVGSCFHNGLDTFNAGKVGQFFYGSGHMQKIAASTDDMNLYNLSRQGFADEIMSVLGTDLDLKFDVDVLNLQVGPIAAGAMNTTPVAYEKLLAKIVSKQLKMYSLLGTQSVQTGIPGLKYSLGHWVESDGTFSSVGALGFYPWIDSSKTYWGVLARLELDPAKVANASVQSQACGQKIRKAMFTQQAQLN